jgi:methyl-accepting chemotaxis protein
MSTDFSPDDPMSVRVRPEELMAMLDRSHAIIEFSPEGVIEHANANFLEFMGYALEEIRGRHHRIFVIPEEAASIEYERFWTNLRNGQHFTAEFKRVTKSGAYVWIQATYTPVRGGRGEVRKVIKFASDITADRRRRLEYEAKLEGIDKSQAVIEFEPTGVVESEEPVGAESLEDRRLNGRMLDFVTARQAAERMLHSGVQLHAAVDIAAGA